MTKSIPVVRLSSESLRGLPGYRVRRLAALWLDPVALARGVDAPLADLHAECAALAASGCSLRARWAAVRGTSALCVSLVAFGASGALSTLPRWLALALGGAGCTFALFALLSNAIRAERGVIIATTVKPRDPWRPAPVVLPDPPRTSPPKAVRPRLQPKGGDGPRIAIVREGPEFRGPVGRSEGPGVWVPELLPAPTLGIRSGPDIDVTPIVRIPPDYPVPAITREIEGFVVVRLWVGRSGEVSRAEVAQAQPQGVFERNTLAAVRRWKYRPGQIDGEAVERGPLEVMLNFSLDDAKR